MMRNYRTFIVVILMSMLFSQPSAGQVTVDSVIAAFAERSDRRIDFAVADGRQLQVQAAARPRFFTVQVQFTPKSCGPAGGAPGLMIYVFEVKSDNPLLMLKPNDPQLRQSHNQQQQADLIVEVCGSVFGDDMEDVFSPIRARPRFGHGIAAADRQFFTKLISLVDQALH